VGEESDHRQFINNKPTTGEHQEAESELPTASDRDDYDPLACDHPLHKGHPIETHKSIIPLAKLKGLIDEIDIPDVQDARCETCANCPACKLSAREKTKSLQEEFEQDVIKKSIETDPALGVVFANLPFLRDPVEYLTKKHGGNNNRYQAARIYQAQCKSLSRRESGKHKQT
jgi:transposase